MKIFCNLTKLKRTKHITMKTKQAIHRVIAVALLSVAVALAGIALAESKSLKDAALPLIVKNGPPGPRESKALKATVWNLLEGSGVLSFERGGVQPTNLQLQAFFATVAVDGFGKLFLSNAAGPATNYFSTNNFSYDGNQTVTFGTVTNMPNWANAEFELKDSEFETNSRGDSLMVFLGKSGDYEGTFIYSVESPVTSTNYYRAAISCGGEEYLETDTKYSFNIHAPAGVSTNLSLKAYLVQVQTNVSGNLYLTNVPLVPSALTTANFLKSGTNLFNGTSPVPIVPEGSSKVEFELNGAEFEDSGQGPCFLLFLGTSTNAGAKFDVAWSFLVRP
jgi:hypothetical protein